MSTLTATYPTLLDVAKRTDSSGRIATIVELLALTNPMIDDMPMIECNDGTRHQTTVRTGLPAVTWRKLNYGVANSKSRTAQIADTTGMLETYAKVDKALADLNGNTAAFRLSEDKAFLEAMSQEAASTILSGDTDVDPEKFLGLGPRFDDHTTAESKDQIILGDGSGGTDQTSIWIVGWGPESVHGIYPKGSTGGLQARDLGEDTSVDSNGLEFQIYRSHYKWDLGLTCRDWRDVVRICNIDKSNLTKNAASGADIVDLLTQGVEQFGSGKSVNAVIYCNRSIRSWLRRQIQNKTSSQLTWENVAGKPVMMFGEFPIKRCDAITSSESVIS